MAEDEKAVEEIVKKEVEMSLDDILMAIAEILKPYIKEMADVKEEIETLEGRFNKIADQPGAKKIPTNLKTEAKDAMTRAELRFEKLVELRKTGQKLN